MSRRELARFTVVGEDDDKALHGWTEGDKQPSTHADLTFNPAAWEVGTTIVVYGPEPEARALEWQTPADIAARFVGVTAQRARAFGKMLGLQTTHHYQAADDTFSPEAVGLIERELRSRGYQRRDERPAPNPTKPHTRREG